MRHRVEGQLPYEAAITYDIPDNFGGLTKAMLQRSLAIGEARGEPVPILTVAIQPRLTEVANDLVARGLLPAPHLLRNLWAELVDWDHDRLHTLGARVDTERPRGGGPAAEGRFAVAHGDLVDLFRPDGTRLARQRWLRRRSGTPLTPYGDAVSHTWLFDEDGSWIGGWPGTWELWRAWVRITTAAPARFICDGASAADAFAHFAAPGISVAVVIHNNHLATGVEPPVGPLGTWRHHLLAERDGFDAIVFLTEKQRNDAELLLGPISNASVVPNPLAGTARRGLRRVRRRGVMLASLDRRKRVEHAIEAVTGVSDTTLHIFGSGERHDRLQRLIDRLDAPAVLEGQTNEPATELARSSYLVLSSRREGLPLVLAESMREGCIPVAYNVPYGPSDVIDDGINGFLAEPGDVDALRQRIIEVTSLSWWRATRMRRAARRRAGDFTSASIAATWQSMRAVPTPEPQATDLLGLSARERIAYVLRTGNLRLRARLEDAHWGTDQLQLKVLFDLIGNDLPEIDSLSVGSVVANLVKRSDGRQTPVNLIRSDEGATMEVALEDMAHDTVLLIEAEVDQMILATLIEKPVHPGRWSFLAPGTGPRQVLRLVPGRGITLGSSRPIVTGVVALGDRPCVHTRSMTGTIPDAVELSAADATPIRIDTDASGRAELPDLAPGRWRVRARTDEQ